MCEIPMGVIILLVGIYTFQEAWKIIVLKQKILIYPVRLGVWLNRKLKGAEAAAKFQSEKSGDRTVQSSGMSGLLVGILCIFQGIFYIVKGYLESSF